MVYPWIELSELKAEANNTREVATQIKNQELVKQRRRQIVDAAVQLFVRYGYHKTTTRALARKTGLSIGSLYEYISAKEDILYLVCIAIHSEVEEGIQGVLARSLQGRQALAEIIRQYIHVCDRMSDHVLLMYHFTNFLPKKWQKKVLETEIRITSLLIEAIRELNDKSVFEPLDQDAIDLLGHNISVIGQTWAFRRWYFSKHCSLEQYISRQTAFLMGFLK
jgi:TetR/AcrR family transcriptional regulator, cholesterol catabolism regulator